MGHVGVYLHKRVAELYQSSGFCRFESLDTHSKTLEESTLETTPKARVRVAFLWQAF